MDGTPSGATSGDFPTLTAPRFTRGDLYQAGAPLSIDPFTGSYTPSTYQKAEPFAPYQKAEPFAPYQKADPFTYAAFQGPTLEEAKQEPGYAFARDQGIGALENSAAARGVLRTGGTLKDVLAWGNRFAEQNFSNVYNRAGQTYDRQRGNAFSNWQANEAARLNAYGANRATWQGNEAARFNAYGANQARWQANEAARFGAWNANEASRLNAFDRSLAAYTTNADNALDAYRTNEETRSGAYDRNLGARLSAFDRNYASTLAEFNPQFRAAELGFEDLYRRNRDELDALTRVATNSPV